MPAGPSHIFPMVPMTRSRPSSSPVYADDSLTCSCTAPLLCRPRHFVQLETSSLEMISKPRWSLLPVHSPLCCHYYRRQKMALGRKRAGQFPMSLPDHLPKSKPLSTRISSHRSSTSYKMLTSKQRKRRAGRFPTQPPVAFRIHNKFAISFPKAVSSLCAIF